MSTQERTAAQVKSWANELIDLSRRNTSLFYKPLKRGTLQIVSPAPTAVLRRLQQNQNWHFVRPPAEPSPTPWTIDDSIRVARSDELVTERTTAKDLELTLKNLARLAGLDLADRGLESLYLTFGMLHWRRPDEDENRSPLLFVPVQLVRNSPRDPFRLIRLENDPVVNLSLRVLLEQEFDLQLPGVEAGETQDLDLSELLETVGAAVQSRGWHVEPTVTIKRATFHKEAMYKDLTDHLDMIVRHPMVRALSAPEEVIPTEGEPPLETELDEVAPPEQTKLILDADGSQRRAVAAAQHGLSFVMDGPPGTGKSQTIANMITQLISDGRTVLFVSEKLAALQVVAGRLGERGLGPFLLELHGQKVGRREVADRLGEALRRRPVGEPRLSSADLARAARLRERLSQYATAVNVRREPLMRTVQEIVGRLAQLAALPAAPLPAGIGLDLSADDVARLLDKFGRLARVWSPVDERANFVWRGLSLEHSEPGIRPELQQLTDQLRRTIEQIEDLSDQLADETSLRAPRDLGAAEQLAAVLEHVAEQPETERSWWTSPSLDTALDRLTEFATVQRAQEADVRTLESHYGRAWEELDPAERTRYQALRAAVDAELLVEPGPGVRDLARQVAALHATAEFLEELETEAAHIANSLRAPDRRRTIEECADLAVVASHANDQVRPEVQWSSPAVIGRVEAAINVLGPLVEHYHSRRAALEEIFTPAVEELPLTDLVVRFEQRHKGFRKLSSAYREDKRVVAAATRLGKATKEVRSHLREAMELQAAGLELDAAHERSESILGAYAQERATDTNAANHALGVLREALGRLRQDYDAAGIAAQLCGDMPQDPALAERALRTVQLIEKWRATVAHELTGPAMNAPPPTLDRLLGVVRKTLEAAEPLLELVRQVEAKRLQPADLDRLGEELAHRATVEERRRRLRAEESIDRRHFGDFYTGFATEVAPIDRGLRWAIQLQQIHGGPLPPGASDQLHRRTPAADPQPLREACTQARKLEDGLLVRFDDESRRNELAAELNDDLSHAIALLKDLEDRLDQIDVWRAYVGLLSELRQDGWSAPLQYAVDERLRNDQLSEVLERALLTAWFNAVVEDDDSFGSLRADDLLADLAEFRRLDHALLDDAAQRVAAECAARRPVTTIGQAKIIEKEAQKRSRHMPVRLLLEKTASVTQALKPCFLMSPLTVSEFLPSTFHFDAVIFDEASQVTPADAINCVYRGTQLIVAGDDKQLPPTSFFDRAGIDDTEIYEEGQLDDFESVLGLCKGAAGMHSIPLQWHYRSQHESLIDFSNRAFYDSNLVTFPGAAAAGPSLGVALEVVEGWYRAGTGRDNPIEAGVVAERVLERAASQPSESIGVVTFSQAQAETVANAVDQLRLDRPDLDAYFAKGGPDAFFVKALENVQGDERDVILFSVGYGPQQDGAFSANFGPLNRKGGERRLNVAVTRARRKVELFASFQPEELAGKAKAVGLVRLLDYMRYAREMTTLSRQIHGVPPADQALADEVATTIRGWGYEVHLGVGMSSYRVDLGVRTPGEDGAYLLGVELDGSSYAAAPVARDRERLRQEVLARLGWPIHRVWGPAFHLDRAGSEQRLRSAIEDAANGRLPQIAPRAAPVELAVVDVDFDAPPAWTAPYVVACPSIYRWHHPAEPEAMSDIIRASAEIIAVEAPITLELLTARIAAGYGVNATKRVRQSVDRAVATLVRRGEITQEGETLLGSAPVAVRVPTEQDPASFRDIDQLPPRELAVAVTSLLEDARGLSSDELVVALARLFGFKRTGARIRQGIEDVVLSLIDEGLVSYRRDGTLQKGEAELPDETRPAQEGDLQALIQQGESSHLEFKSTLRTDTTRGSVMKELEKVVSKTVAGFLNGGGGTLLIGVADDGAIVGLEPDYRTLGQKGDRDGFELHVMQVLGRAVGAAALAFVRVSIHKLEEKDVCRIDVRRSPEPVFVTEGQTPVFYVRLGNATQPMSVADAHQYIKSHW
jgi:hypothetical protein